MYLGADIDRPLSTPHIFKFHPPYQPLLLYMGSVFVLIVLKYDGIGSI